MVVYENLGVAVVRVVGRLDHVVAADLRLVLSSAQLPVVIDCAALEVIDEDGLAMLDDLARACEQVVLRRVPEDLRSVIESGGLTDLVAFAER